MYAGYTQGIEDSGAAPGEALNRGQTLPSTRTWQRELGVQYSVTPKVKSVVGVFDVHKPYFNLDAVSKLYVDLATQEHWGLEFSLAGEIAKNLNLVVGLELLNPKVQSNELATAPIGPPAVGQHSHLAVINMDYKLPWIPALSFDLAATSYGRSEANLTNTVAVPAAQSFDLGSRYSFNLGNTPASLRGFILNAGNVYRWNVSDSGGFIAAPRRGFELYLTVEL